MKVHQWKNRGIVFRAPKVPLFSFQGKYIAKKNWILISILVVLTIRTNPKVRFLGSLSSHPPPATPTFLSSTNRRCVRCCQHSLGGYFWKHYKNSLELLWELSRQHSSASERSLETFISTKKKKPKIYLALSEPTKPQHRIGSTSWILALGKSELSYCSPASGFDSAWMGEKSRHGYEIPASSMLQLTSKLKAVISPKSHTSTVCTGLKGIK